MSKWNKVSDMKRLSRMVMPLDAIEGLPDNHVILVTERTIEIDESELVQNNVSTDTYTLELDAEWDDITPVVIFSNSQGDYQVAYENGPTKIPAAVMAVVGSVDVSVFGLDSTGAVRVVTKAAPNTMTVVESGKFVGEVSEDDISLLGQLLAAAEAANEAAANANATIIKSAVATTLNPGEPATANIADNVLTIGVPKGEKGDKGDPGTAATIAVGSVTGLPAGASPTVNNSGTTNAAVLDFGIPKGDKGDKGDPGTTPTVVAAEGSDLSVSTDEGTVTIDDSALRARISELEQQTQNVVTGTSTGLVSHGEDAYAQKPREVRVKGKTWVNRWPVINGTSNGITVTTDGTGLVTVTGTATADADVTADVSGWAAGKSYTTMVNATPTGCSAYFEVQKPSGNTSINATTTGATLNVASDATNCVAGVHVTSGTTVNASFRVMLVDGTEAPDCFTPPASITSAQPENLVTSGKNLLPETPSMLGTSIGGITFTRNDDGSIHIEGTGTATYPQLSIFNGLHFPPGITVSVGSATTGAMPDAYVLLYGIGGNASILVSTSKTGSIRSGTTDGKFEYYRLIVVAEGKDVIYDGDIYFWLELGSTATAYEPPTVTTTPLPEVELRSLPDGTCDELVIKEDGTCEVERRTGYIASYTDEEVAGEYVSTGNGLEAGASIVYELDEPTTEPQSTVTLPALPAPTFNQYHDSPVPSDTSTEYVRDINLVLANLESVQAALLGGE